MTKKTLILSTPDIRDNALLDHLTKQFDVAYLPRLNQIDGYPIAQLEKHIVDLHQQISQAPKKKWYQPVSITEEFLSSEVYQQSLSTILLQLQDSNWMLHDPLLVHSLSLWLSAVERPSLVFYYSHPLECALALQQAWRFPIQFGLALWEYFVLLASKQLHDKNPVLISQSKLRNSAKMHLTSVLTKLDVSLPEDWSVFSADKLVQSIDIEYDTQQTLFAALEKGNIKSLSDCELSSASADMLEYYGQLRAGFEQVKEQRDHLKSELGLGQSKINVPQPESVVVDESLCKVTVYLEGREPLEFYSDPTSPILEMLQNYLVSHDQDELIYLNCGEQADDTIYFMSSSMLGMETEPVVTH